MANIPLQSISFPGLSDKYTTPVVDNTLTQAGAAADAKKTGDEIGAIKNDLSDGTMTVNNAENAEQLTSTVGIEGNAPYLYRTSGGSVDIGDREDVKKIVGGTIVNNQLIDPIASTTVSGGVAVTSSNGIFTFSGSAEGGGGRTTPLHQNTINVVTGHKYAVITSFDKTIFTGIYVTLWSDISQMMSFSNGEKDIKNATFSGSACFGINTITNRAYSESGYFMLCDLTQTFGTAIADYAYSLEVATAGAGMAWLKKNFPAQFNAGYQAYDTGSLQSVSGLTEHKMVGFNQWDEVAEIGSIDANGQNETDGTRLRSKNYIPVVPNTNYYFMNNLGSGNGNYVAIFYYDANKSYVSKLSSSHTNFLFTTPENCAYVRFFLFAWYGTTYNHDICINFHWDSEKDGTYEPYKTWSYALDSSLTLRGIPKVDASGNLYYDGDEYLPDGTVNRRYGIVDLGTLDWSKYVDSNIPVFYQVLNINMKVDGGLSGRDTKCVKYLGVPWTPLSQRVDKTIAIHPTIQAIYIADSSYTDPEDFRLAMSGVYLVFPLETPTTETAEPYQSTQIVDDFGTEEFVLTDGAFPVPVGHETYYKNNLRAKLEMSPESPDGDGLYVVQQESGENTYVPLASTATIQDILTRLTALENA